MTRTTRHARKVDAGVYRRRRIGLGAALVLLLGTVFAVMDTTPTAPVQAAVNNPSRLDGSSLSVVDDTPSHTPITKFKYIINEDNTGTTAQRSPSDGCSPDDPGYPESCKWTSMGIASKSPIVTQGDQNDFTGTGIALPNGRYLISVLADGYKLDGQHFTIPLDGEVVVQLSQPPLPDAMIQAAVFEDISPVNSAPDLPAEHGLAGFSGIVRDTLGEVTTDVYGDPLCGNGVCLSYCYVVQNGVDIGVARPNADRTCPTVGADQDPTQLTNIRMYRLNSAYAPDPLNPPNWWGVIPPASPDYSQRGTTNSQWPNRVPGDAAIEGKVKVPNLGTNRFTLAVTPPDTTNFVQTTTLEGNHDYDSWIMEGATGLDTEFVVAGEPFPAIIFGYVHGGYSTLPTTGGATITGVVDKYKVYVPSAGGLPIGGDIFGGLSGGKIAGPIDSPWVSLSALGNGDTAVWVGQGTADGKFTIPNVPDGDYTLTWWDEPQDYILAIQNVTVAGGDIDVGVLPLTGWWTEYSGYVFNDANRNGVMDWTDLNGDGCPQANEGETGVPNFGLTMRRRENTLMDRGTNAVSTDACGFYYMESGYPMTQWLVMEAYNDLYYTTGVTYQADNQPTPTTVMGAGVDVNTLPIIGQSGTLDWGVHSYDAKGTNGIDPQNGGIVGSVSYDTTRNELDPRYAAVEDWQPGVPGLTVDLYAPVECTGASGEICDADGYYQLAADGSYLLDPNSLLQTYTTETWAQPGDTVVSDPGVTPVVTDGNCVPRDVEGNELTYPAGQQITNSASDCLEAPLMGVQFQNGYSTVDGNFGFGDGCQDAAAPFDKTTGKCADGSDPTALKGASDYLVHVEVPTDIQGRPTYQFTREEDINIGNGDQFQPQVPPPACAGALHTVDVLDAGVVPGHADNYDQVVGDGTINTNYIPVGVTVPASTPVDNPTFLDIAGSPYEGMQKPSCDTKLVPLANGKSTAPLFNVFTDVPIPGHFWGLIVDDLNFSTDPHQINFGEKAGVPFAPVGIYDYKNRLVQTVESDYSGLFDVLLPSTNRINCPTPSGICANVYRFVGNDPGTPGHLNSNYKPDYRTIAAEFEAVAGNTIPADLAPTQVGVTVQLPGGQAVAVECATPATQPQLYRVSKPFVTNADRTFTISGLGFGSQKGRVTLDGVDIDTAGWSDTGMTATVPVNVEFGAHQLAVTTATGLTTVNGLTFHVIGAPMPATFPSTPVLDNFNRATLGTGWGNFAGLSGFDINNNQLRQRTSNRAGNLNGTFGASQEAYVTIADLGPTGSVYGVGLKGVPSIFFPTGIRVLFGGANGTTGQIQTQGPGLFAGWENRGSAFTLPAAIKAGDIIGGRAAADGTVTAFVNGTAIPNGSVNVITAGWPKNLSDTGGQIGVYESGATNGVNGNDIRFDDFGGGNYIEPAGGPTYAPTLYEVGPGKTYDPANSLPATADHAIQRALDAAAAAGGDALVVVYPGRTANDRTNPRGAYFENLIITKGVKLQGVGSGSPDGSVAGSIIDGGAFGGDGPVASDWYANLTDRFPLDATGEPVPFWDGNQSVNDGAAITIYTNNGAFGSGFKPSIDGFDIRGGNQQGFPGNIDIIGGGNTGLPANVVTQGGAIFANAYADNLQITNNVVQNNGGAYGTIRIGTPDINGNQNHNQNVRIANNRIIANAGTNLAGGIGIFGGSDGYTVAGNDICGNFSAEYGGGITAYGLSPNGTIENNRIWFNRSYDEGGGVMIAGTLPADPAALSSGSGAVTIRGNVIQSNLANDDGGGLRFLMAGTAPIDVYNNMIVNNVSTHEGGGVGINDTTNVRFYNNTVMKNLTTATAATSNGLAAPAGLSTSTNSVALQGSLPGGSPSFSDPVLFNNIFWDNRAGTLGLNTVTGLGLAGPLDIANWDMGVADNPALSLSPTNSVIETTDGTVADPSNVTSDPQVVSPFDTVVSFNGWRTNPNFIGATLVSLDLPPDLLGNYHLKTSTPAFNIGVSSKGSAPVVSAPSKDIDGQDRPSEGGYEAGADELPGPKNLSFPLSTSPILDDFNRANSGNLGPNWPVLLGSNTGYRVFSGALEIRGGAASPKLFGSAPPNQSQEAFFTFTDVSAVASQGLVLRSTASGDAGIRVVYNRPASTVTVYTVSGGNATLQQTIPSVSFVNGDQFGARVTRQAGTDYVSVYRNGSQVGGAVPASVGSCCTTGRYIGLWFTGTTNTASGNAAIDNFGGSQP